MKDFAISIFLLVVIILCVFVIDKQSAQIKLVSSYQIESMKVAKAQCEADNQGKECILIWDYLAVKK